MCLNYVINPGMQIPLFDKGDLCFDACEGRPN